MNKSIVRKFIVPKLNRKGILRLGIVAILAYSFFGYLCIPAWVRGYSMEPTYHNGTLSFCWTLKYLFSSPDVGDVVMIRMAGRKVMFLKRVVAVAGETLQFKNGVLYVDGKVRKENYVHTECNWALQPRTVKPGHVYVVGDNRNMPIHAHEMGQTPITRIIGGPLW